MSSRETALRWSGHARSLVWRGDRLDDLLAGVSVGLDGMPGPESGSWAYPFDRALLSPSGTYAVAYTERATKALVIGPSGAREINRSYYHADKYAYPIALGRLPDGREVLAHCPDEYNRLVIEDVADGTRLASATAEAEDVFHSDLAISPGGRYLLSAGWVWQGLQVVCVFDLAEVLASPAALDEPSLGPGWAFVSEVEAACWLDDDTITISSDPGQGGAGDEEMLSEGEMGVWSMPEQRWVARAMYGAHTGPLHAFGDNVLALYEHPREIDPRTGAVVNEWPHRPTGTRTGCLFGYLPPVPVVPVAVDGARRRFAVADRDVVTVVEA